MQKGKLATSDPALRRPGDGPALSQGPPDLDGVERPAEQRLETAIPPGAEQEAGTDSTQRPPTSSGADSPRGRFDPQLVSW
jgi:hypothetical protein|eukprot:COSAG01_NODE_215_length_21709_cov_141.101217_22_plen_81_part_00